jgi:O-antigen ligase
MIVRARRPGSVNGAIAAAVAGGCVLAALTGPIVASSLTLTYGVAAILILLAVLAASARQPIGAVLIVAIVVVSALNDVPQRLHVGPTTAQGIETISLVAVMILVYLNGYAGAGVSDRRRLFPVAMFVLWTVASFGWGTPNLAGLQNVAVYGAFAGMLVIAATVGRWRPVDSHRALDIAFRIAAVVGLPLYAISYAAQGHKTRLLVSPRPFALFGLILVAWFMAAHVNGSRLAKWIVAATVLLTVLSLSRSALAAQFAVITLAYFGTTTNFRKLIRSLVVTLTIVALAAALVSQYAPLRDRFFQGDVHKVGSISLNVMGRDAVWAQNWVWFKEKPWIGWGAGASDQKTSTWSHASVLPQGVKGTTIGHPHNDYLRILVDFGIVGLLIWIIAYIGLLRMTWRRWRDVVHSRTPAEHVSCAAFLALVGISLTMMVDNPLIEIAKMAPLGAIVGLAAGMASARSVDGSFAANIETPAAMDAVPVVSA